MMTYLHQNEKKLQMASLVEKLHSSIIDDQYDDIQSMKQCEMTVGKDVFITNQLRLKCGLVEQPKIKTCMKISQLLHLAKIFRQFKMFTRPILLIIARQVTS
jgi:hypothetical protein